MSDKFFTVSKQSEGLYKEKGSKFVAYAFPVQSEEDIKYHLKQLKKEHYNARHYCYAFIIGHPTPYFRANDDGEPNHSAGDPILRQIQSLNLTNTLVIVVRYFGGTKLGVSGLVNAYKTAAAEALQQNEIIEKYLTVSTCFFYDYDQTNVVMKLVTEFNAEIFTQDFQARCKMEVKIKKSDFAAFIQALEKANISI
ncbi:MAG: YigZ family protein [Cyclobacteriaceae bacterium]